MTAAEALAHAARLDDADVLAPLRAEFALPRGPDGAPLIYLCGHSLGLAPRAAAGLVLEQLEDWQRLGALGHLAARRPWLEFTAGLRPGLAALTGARVTEVVAMNSLTVNLHLMLASFYRPAGERHCVLIEAGAFSSDRHAVTSQIAWHGLDPAACLIEMPASPVTGLIDEAELEALLTRRGAEIALVLWPGVQFRTGQVFDVSRLARACRRAGCPLGLDLAHAIGNVPLQLHGDDVDFAVWCGYKYLNGGPGAVAGAFIHERHLAAAAPRLSGWWGHEAASRFAMGAQFVPSPDAEGWQLSNPPIFSSAPLLASLQLFARATLPALHRKSQALDDFLRALLQDQCGTLLQVVTPADPARRGNQCSLRLRDGRAGRAVFERLSTAGVVCDWREPDTLRLAAVPLYNSFTDVAHGVQRLAAALRGP